MKHYIKTIIILLVFSNTGFTQQNIDSLLNKLHLSDDSEKPKILNQLSEIFLKSSIDNSLEYSLQAVKISKQTGNKNQLAIAFMNTGNVFYKKQNRKEALVYYKKALETNIILNDIKAISESRLNIGICYAELGYFQQAIDNYQAALKINKNTNNKKQTGILLYNIGNVYFWWGKYDKAIDYYQKAYQVFERCNYKIGISSCYNTLGAVYENWSTFDKALDFYQKALQIEKNEKNDIGIANVLNNIGNIYSRLKNYDKAREYYLNSLNIRRKINDITGIATSLNNIGTVYMNKGNFKQAFEYFDESLVISSSIENYKEICTNLFAQGNTFLSQKDYNNALNLLMKSLAVSEKYGLMENILDNCKSISEILYLQGNHEKSLYYFKKYSSTKDSLFKKESREKLTEFETYYKTKQKQKEIELNKALLAKKQIENRTQRKIFIIALSSLFIVIIVICYSYIKAKKDKKIISEKNKIIEQSGKELIKLNAAKDKFFSIISHDLKNPFKSLCNVSEKLYMQYHKLPEERKYEDTEIIFESSRRTNKLLENLLFWSMAQTGSLDLKPEMIDLFQIVEENIALFKISAVEKNLTLTSHLIPGTKAYADYKTTSCIVRNLISNAIKFTGSGCVEISIQEDDKHIEISVKDTGIGLIPEDIDKLFRIDVSPTTIGETAEKGTGLGLILCKEFVKKNEGSIKVQSEKNKGSTFTFILPKFKIN